MNRPLARTALATLALLAGGCEMFGGGGDGQDRIYGVPEPTVLDGVLTDERFVTEAASAGMFEVQSSRLAAERGVDRTTADFADRMIQDHTAANRELLRIAQRHGLAVPAKMLPRHERMLDELRPLRGAQLAQRYHEFQRRAHDEAVTLFQRAAAEVQNPDLRAFAQRTLPTLEDHRHHLTGHHHAGQ